MSAEQDDDLPLLDDVVRTGREPAREGNEGQNAGETHTLSEAEIEAIAKRVVERHTKQIEEAVARAIRTALETKKAGDGSHHEG